MAGRRTLVDAGQRRARTASPTQMVLRRCSKLSWPPDQNASATNYAGTASRFITFSGRPQRDTRARERGTEGCSCFVSAFANCFDDLSCGTYRPKLASSALATSDGLHHCGRDRPGSQAQGPPQPTAERLAVSATLARGLRKPPRRRRRLKDSRLSPWCASRRLELPLTSWPWRRRGFATSPTGRQHITSQAPEAALPLCLHTLSSFSASPDRSLGETCNGHFLFSTSKTGLG